MPMSMCRTVAVLACLLGPGCATSSTTTTPSTPGHTPPSSPQTLFEAAVVAQFGSCPGVEVVPRGQGFLAGRYGGKVVLVSGAGACLPFKDDKGNRKVEVSMTWRSVDPETNEAIASLERSVTLDEATCPSDYRDPAVLSPFTAPNQRVCSEGFVPLRQPVSLSNLVAPMLSPMGTVRTVKGPEGDESQETIAWDINGRTVHLEGTATCRPATSQLETSILGSAMVAWVINLDVKMTEPTSRQRLGQWREHYIQLLGISCDAALGLKGNAAKIDKARDLWEQRFFDAVQRSTP
jgi:hypothetical protein